MSKKKTFIIILQIVFWIAYYLLATTILHKVTNDWRSSFVVGIVNLVGVMGLIYFYLYYLLPRYWDKKRYVLFTLGLIIAIALSSFYRYFATLQFFGSKQAHSDIFGNHELLFQFLIGSLFMILLATPLRIINVYIKKLELEKQMEKERFTSEIQFLKTQLNPHFLFNVLNNIYSLAYTKSDKTPDMILKLSEMMSYMLYDINDELVSLQSEISYLQNYIDLHQLKNVDNDNIRFHMEGDPAGIQVAPLMFICLIENAFKHGDMHENADGWINVDIKIIDETIHFNISNSYPDPVLVTTMGGVGLENFNRRLQLLYPDKHSLEVHRENGVYALKLILSCTSSLQEE